MVHRRRAELALGMPVLRIFAFTIRSGLSLAALLGVAAIATPARAQTSGANGTHDPSRMIESDGKFYVYSTGGGSKSSTDGLVWTNGPAMFPSGIPNSTTSLVPNNEGVWAPDVIFLNNQYYLYYAIANADNACAVGLVTTPTLDPSSPNYKLTDRGVVVSNTGSATYCAIDPCPNLDASGNLWLTFGSGYTKSSTDNTIYVMRLDNTTGLPSTAGAAPGTPLEPGHIEASYVYYHVGYYYLFWNSGGCCSGASSTYEIHMARSEAITGPYTGAQIFLQSEGSVHGPGQIGIYDKCGADRFTYHYYPDTGGSVLGENELSWGSDGWPVAGAVSTTPLTPCANVSTGDAGGGGSEAGSPESGTSESGGSDASDDVGVSLDAGTLTDATTQGGSSGDAGGVGAGTDAGSSGSGPNADSGVSSDSGGSSGTPPVGSGSGCSCSARGSRRSVEGLGSLILFGLAFATRRLRGKKLDARPGTLPTDP
jgi:hypothetical protein